MTFKVLNGVLFACEVFRETGRGDFFALQGAIFQGALFRNSTFILYCNYIFTVIEKTFICRKEKARMPSTTFYFLFFLMSSV